MGQPPKLVREDPAKPAYLIVELPLQSFAKEAFLDATGPDDSSIALASLSLKASESLAVSKLLFGSDLTLTSELPFLGIILFPHRPATDAGAALPGDHLPD